MVVLVSTSLLPSSNQPEPLLPRLLFPGTEVSLDAAQQMVSFHVAVPSSVQPTYAYTSIRIDTTYPTGPLLYLIYSSVPLSANTTVDELIAAQGFFIVEVPEPATNSTRVIDAQVQYNSAARVSVNGDPGCYAGNQLHWWANGIHYAIVSSLTRSETLAIAASMQT